jgi:hypothetical protein
MHSTIHGPTPFPFQLLFGFHCPAHIWYDSTDLIRRWESPIPHAFSLNLQSAVPPQRTPVMPSLFTGSPPGEEILWGGAILGLN